MRKFIVAVVAVMALAALPAMALAGIQNSVHDLPDFFNYTGTSAKMGTCSFCHIPHKAASGGEKLFPESYSSGLPDAWSSDSLSNICWFCHGAASGYTTAQSVNPFQATSHLRQTTLLTGGIQGAGEADVASVPTGMDLTGTQLRCVSCHSIHDNAKRPFLRWGTSGNLSAEATNGFCGKCHVNRDNAATFGNSQTAGMHPSRTSYADVGANSPLVGTTTLPLIFQNDMANLTNAIAGAWNLGGHALYTGGTEGQTIICGSCHAVHANETAVWTDDGASGYTTPVAPLGNDLVILNAAPTAGADNFEDICEACHSVNTTRGPGATGTFSHPVGIDSVWGESMRVAGEGYLWNTGSTNSTIICQSCHDMHFSASNHGTSATGAYLQAFQCDECHAAAGAVFAAGVHHVTNIANANTKADPTPVASTATDWAARTQTAGTVNYWTLGTGTTLTCVTCHSSGNAHAHNNVGQFPGLTGINTESDMCVDCHSFNPSTYTTTSTLGTSTHFVGTITDTAYKVTTTLVAGSADNAPRYGESGAALICESCHTIRINGKNSHVVSYQWSNNASDGLASTKDAVQNVLLVSGNSDDLAAVADNLCTACHGASPGAGVTHPVLPTYSTASSMIPSGQCTTIAGQAAGKINCESCHRPHDAATDSMSADWSNSWILEAATNPGTYIEYAPLCLSCHQK